MKTLFKYILAAVMTLSFAACQEEIYGPGEPDLLDCHGLFFPQEQARDYEAAPGEVDYIAFTVERTLDAFEAYVPYEITCSEEGFFFLEDEYIYFDEDAKKTTIKVYFSDDFETGKKYTCTIRVTDPQYVANYGLSSNELTFSLTLVEWKLLGEGLWRDDFFTSYGAAIGAKLIAPYHEKKVKVYQRSDLPGYYRVDNVYTPEYISYIAEGNENNAAAYADYCPAPSLYINASDPAKVYFPAQLAFYDPSPYGYGAVYLCSDVAEVFDAGYSNLYGTLKDGSITFPKNALVAYLPSAGAAYANAEGKHRLVLPGYEPYDFSIDVKVSPAAAGVLPVEFTMGHNVAKVNYRFFDGHLTDVEMVSKLEEVKKGTQVETVTASGKYDLTLPKTGLYTLIACSYDAAGNFKEYATAKFGYDTATDPKKVDLHLGLIVSDKYANAGLTSENSMEFYVYGSEITEAKVAIYKKAHFENYRDAVEAEIDYYVAPLGREELALVNGIGYTGLIGNLTAGTEYILIVYAGNGYHNDVFYSTVFTGGEYKLLDTEFALFDLATQYQSDKDVYFKDWEVWSVDPFTEPVSWDRKKRAVATIADDDDMMFDENGNITEDPDNVANVYDYITISGMYPNAAEKYSFDDTIQLEYYEGFVYTMMTQMSAGEYKGKPIYPTNAYLFYDGSGLSPYLENGAMVGGFVTPEQDVIAFVGNPLSEAGTYGYSYIAMMLCYFTEEDYSGNAPLIEEDCHVYPLLIAPGSKYTSDAASASSLKAPAACSRISGELQKARTNYVETDRGYIMSTIDKFKTAPYNYMQNLQKVSDTAVTEATGLGSIVRTLR